MDFDFQSLAFLGFAAIAAAAALAAITARNAVHAVLYLVLTFFSVACTWITGGVEFLGIALVLVYVGAVMVLFLFVIMLLDLKEEERRKLRKLALGGGVIAVGALAGLFVISLVGAKPGTGLPAPAVVGSTFELGKLLFTNYLLPFEIVSVLLLVAVVGVVLLSKKDLK